LHAHFGGAFGAADQASAEEQEEDVFHGGTTLAEGRKLRQYELNSPLDSVRMRRFPSSSCPSLRSAKANAAGMSVAV
jgi:hypothetical protein